MVVGNVCLKGVGVLENTGTIGTLGAVHLRVLCPDVPLEVVVSDPFVAHWTQPVA